MNVIIALAYTTTYLVESYLMAALSHGMAVSGPMAGVFALASTISIWTLRTRWSSVQGGTVRLVATGALLAATPAVLLPATWAVDSWLDSRFYLGARVANVHDEPLRGRNGEVIGIRLRYDLTLSTVGHARRLPVLGTTDGPSSLEPFWFHISGRDANDAEGVLDAGRKYLIVSDFGPSILRRHETGGLCILDHRLAQQREQGEAKRLRVEVLGTSYGSPRYGQVQWTENAWGFGAMSQAILRQRLPLCECLEPACLLHGGCPDCTRSPEH